MKKIKKSIFTFLLVSTSCFAQNETLLEVLKDSKYFVSFSTSLSKANMDKKDNSGSVTLTNDVDESSHGIGIELGYKYSEDIELSVNYERINNSDVGFDNLYIASRYLFEKQNSFIPYLGAHVGLSQLSWDTTPVATPNNDVESSSYLIGAKLGTLYELNENVKLDVNYSFTFMDHETLVESYPNKSTLNHNYLQAISLALRYEF